jgi:hypothetical protein
VNVSHLGLKSAGSIILKESYWEDDKAFPKNSFYKLEGKTIALD